jgi:ribosomal 30S subunit maturation factor RimM
LPRVAVDGEYLGTITDVLDSSGTEILKVERENEETLIPFAQSYLKEDRRGSTENRSGFARRSPDLNR